jgi:hypothetical protein
LKALANRLAGHNAKRNGRADHVAQTKADVLLAWSDDGLYPKQRFVRAGSGARFYGPTHEALLGGKQELLRGVTFSELLKTDEQIEKKLLEEYLESVNQHGVGCAEHTCGNPRLSKYVVERAKSLGIPVPAIEGFQTKPVPEEHRALLKTYRNSVGGGYNELARQLAISVYFYDREVQDEQADIKEVRGSVVDVLRLHPGARVEMGTSSLPLAGDPTEARGGLLTWRVGPNDYASFLWVIPRTSRWVKIRATYIRPPGKEAEAMEYAAESIRKVVSSICVR